LKPAPEREVWGVVLAAGFSRRCPPGKLLLPWGASSVVGTVAAHLLSAGLGRVLVVVGHEAESVKRALAGLPLEIVPNPAYREGMGTSVAASLDRCLNDPGFPSEAGMLLLPADTPFIGVAVLSAAAAAYREGRGDIVAASHAFRRGHPVVFSRRFAAELRKACLEGEGARQVVRAHPEAVFHLDAGPEVLEDIDTMEDYGRLRGLYDKGEA